LITVERLPATEIAARLRMRVANVFVAKCKVLKSIQEEVKLLEQIDP
jgi:hypothetical protein